jgi:multiple sugar transport system ATP-binding protein
MNLFAGKLMTEAGELQFRSASFRVMLPDAFRAARTSGDSGDVQLGIRPEDVAVVEDRPGNGTVTRGVVDLVEHLGSDAYASVKVGNEIILARVSPDIQLHDGQTVALSFNQSKLHLFDATTGESLLTNLPVVTLQS